MPNALKPSAVAAVGTLSAAMLAGCAHTADTPRLTAVPPALGVGKDERVAFVVPARGVQIYECRVADGKAAWAFVAPEAALFDVQGRTVGKHYAGPTWEHSDGSKLVGTVKARADAPQPSAIPWLLLDTRSTGAGRFTGVTSIQRVNTVGGIAPPTGCSSADVGKREQVAYTADYYLFKRQ